VTYRFQSEVWLYPGESANWHFVSVPKKETQAIDKRFKSLKRGWGSLPVRATIGKTSWTTSIFPDKKSSTYLLPLKADVRRREDIRAGGSSESDSRNSNTRKTMKR
jgi:hypothetical protein